MSAPLLVVRSAALGLVAWATDLELRWLLDHVAVREQYAVEPMLEHLEGNSSQQYPLKTIGEEEAAYPIVVNLRKASELHKAGIGVVEVGLHTFQEEELPELEDSLADLVDHTDEEAFRTQELDCRNSRREEVVAFLHMVLLKHSQAQAERYLHGHIQDQAAAVADELEPSRVVHMALEEVAVRSLEAVADFCYQYRLVHDAKRHNSA